MGKPHRTVICLCEEGIGRSPNIARSIYHAFTGEEIDPVAKRMHELEFTHRGERIRLLIRGLDARYGGEGEQNYGKTITNEELESADHVFSDVTAMKYLQRHKRHDLALGMTKKKMSGAITSGWKRVKFMEPKDVKEKASAGLGIKRV